MLLSCVVLSYVYDFIFSQGLFRACAMCLILYSVNDSSMCCVFDFMPNQNGFFLSYLMLVPVLSIQYKFLTAVSFLTAVLYVGASVCGP
jgi:hypothetical protein